MSSPIVNAVFELGFPYRTVDPFLFCVFHNDRYPEGTPQYGPAAELRGRSLGQDFSGRSGWSMYHGRKIPGFPPHPHRGFETVTIVKRGIVDHFDSYGSKARYGVFPNEPASEDRFDVQWLTAGKGIVHAEMFPLLSPTKPNPLELFQIWVNLPAKSRYVDPNFLMIWKENIKTFENPQKGFRVLSAAGGFENMYEPSHDPNETFTNTQERALSSSSSPRSYAPKDSYGANPDADFKIWVIKLRKAGGSFVLQSTVNPASRRHIYLYRGNNIRIADASTSTPVLLKHNHGAELVNNRAVSLQNDDPNEDCEILMLQAKPIGEPVVQRGPFVVSTQEELVNTYREYQEHGFGDESIFEGNNEPINGDAWERFADYFGKYRDAPPADKTKQEL